jgi:hypothetical protein
MMRTSLVALCLLSSCFDHGFDSGRRGSGSSGASTANEATQLAGALWEIGTAQLTPGAYFPDASSLANDLRSDLPAEVARALRAVARDRNVCRSGTAVVAAAAQATSPCANIGTYAAGGTLTLTSCVLSSGGTLSGTVVTTNSEALAANATCGANAVVAFTHTSLINLTYTTAANEVVAYSNLSATATVTRELNAPPTSYALTIASGERKDTDPTGTLVADQTASGNVTVVLATRTRTESGTITLNDQLNGDSQSLTETDVVRTPNCCNPTSGTVSWSTNEADAGDDGGASTTHDLVFGPACGQSTLDGTSVTINACSSVRR